MYSKLSMAVELATNDYKILATHRNLGLISRIDELNSMEGDLMKGDHYGISHQSTQGTKKYLDD
jgi:hypothetical protein